MSSFTQRNWIYQCIDRYTYLIDDFKKIPSLKETKCIRTKLGALISFMILREFSHSKKLNISRLSKVQCSLHWKKLRYRDIAYDLREFLPLEKPNVSRRWVYQNLARYIYLFYDLKGFPSLKKLNESWLSCVNLYFIWSQGNSFIKRSWMYCDLTRYTDMYFIILSGFLYSKKLSVLRLSWVHLYVIRSQGDSFTQRSWIHTDIYFMILRGFLHSEKLSLLRLS